MIEKVGNRFSWGAKRNVHRRAIFISFIKKPVIIKTDFMVGKLDKIILITIGALLLFASSALACFNPTDFFATEVLLNKPGVFYNLKAISQAENVRASGDFDRENSTQIIDYRSHYNSDVAVRLFVDSGKDQSLTVKIQIPTKFIDIEKTDLTSAVEGVEPDTFNWSEAMKTELFWLNDNGVILGELTKSDIDQISSACKRGTAGHNSRIFYEDGKWLPYNQSSNPMLLRGLPDYGGFTVEMLPWGILTSLPTTQNTIFAESCDIKCNINLLGEFFGEFSSKNQWIFWLILLWTLPWKGIALWKSARNSHQKWFIALLIFNTMAILEIVYIFFFSKKKTAA